MHRVIEIDCKPNQHPSEAAAEAARAAGTSLAGNLRTAGDGRFGVATADGREVIVDPASRDHCDGCRRMLRTDDLEAVARGDRVALMCHACRSVGN